MQSQGYKIRDEACIYFFTFASVKWVDVFTKRMYADIVLNSLSYCCKSKGLKLFAWCIMSNHVHLIAQAEHGKLSDILRDFKKFTSKSIIKAIENNKQESRRNWMLWIFKKAGENNSRNEHYQFWQQDNHPILLQTPAFTLEKLNYLHRILLKRVL